MRKLRITCAPTSGAQAQDIAGILTVVIELRNSKYPKLENVFFQLEQRELAVIPRAEENHTEAEVKKATDRLLSYIQSRLT